MGNDIAIMTYFTDVESRTFEEYVQELQISNTNSIGLLSLLCFRHYDLKVMQGGKFSVGAREQFDPVIRYVVPFELAIKQLLAGVEVIKNRFRTADVLDPYVEYFIQYLMKYRNNFLHMNCMQYANSMSFDLLLHHALLGIQYPDMKMYYSSDQIECWSGWVKPAANGIMTWCGALRRITHIAGSREEIDHEELFTPSDLEDIDEIGVYGFMRND